MPTSNIKRFRTFLFDEYFNGFSVSNLKELKYYTTRSKRYNEEYME